MGSPQPTHLCLPESLRESRSADCSSQLVSGRNSVSISLQDFESCQTVSIAESAQCLLVGWPAQLVLRDQTSLYAPPIRATSPLLVRQARCQQRRFGTAGGTSRSSR